MIIIVSDYSIIQKLKLRSIHSAIIPMSKYRNKNWKQLCNIIPMSSNRNQKKFQGILVETKTNEFQIKISKTYGLA